MKERWSKIANIASILWFVGVVGVISIIAVASRFLTHDPDFSPGDPENIYLLPMLSFFFVGGLSFGIAILATIIGFFTKGPKPSYKPILGMSFGRSSLCVGIVLFTACAFLFGMRQANVGNYRQEAGTVTGQEVLDAVNKYREDNRLSPIILENRLCDNLVQRYLDIINPDNKYVGHAGFEKWATTEGLTKDYSLAEVYVRNIGSGYDAVKFWKTSPGHNSAILGAYQYGCAYANKDTAVVILGNRVNTK